MLQWSRLIRVKPVMQDKSKSHRPKAEDMGSRLQVGVTDREPENQPSFTVMNLEA